MNKLQLLELERQYNLKYNYFYTHDITKPIYALYNLQHGVIVDNVVLYEYFLRNGYKILKKSD